jgi:hypothetical protein
VQAELGGAFKKKTAVQILASAIEKRWLATD